MMKSDRFTTCVKCGKENISNPITIAYESVRKGLLKNKFQTQEVNTFCVDCGMYELTQEIKASATPIWIGIPKYCDAVISVVNFVPEVIF